MACYQIRCSGHAQPCTSTVNIFKQTVPVTEKNLKSPHSRSHLLLLISSFQLTFALQPTLSEMPSPVALPTSHYFHPSSISVSEVTTLWRYTNLFIIIIVIKSCRLTFFGHLARMDENADASQSILEPPGRPQTTLMKNIYDDLQSVGSWDTRG